jgi:hypothetical protein
MTWYVKWFIIFLYHKISTLACGNFQQNEYFSEVICYILKIFFVIFCVSYHYIFLKNS